MSTYSTWEDPFRPLDPVIARVAENWFEVAGLEAEGGYPLGLLVGEQPGSSSNHGLPLWPYPPRSAGGRLHAMSGIPVRDYLLRLARVNLAHRPVSKWDAAGARGRAYALVATMAGTGARAVLCGARVRDAFEVPAWFTSWTVSAPHGSDLCFEVVAIPHPSGRNREYDNPATVARAREVIRWAAGLKAKA